jgi:outer membrane protein TolC
VVLPEDLGPPVEPLQILIERALQNRLDLQEAADQVDDARRSAALARQNLLPQVDLLVAASRVGAGATVDAALSTADSRVDVAVASSYPLKQASNRASRVAAEAQETAKQRALVERRLEVESEVRSAVRDLDRIRKSVDLQKQGLRVAEQQLRLATLRYQRGLASNFDVVDAESNLVLSRSSLVGLLTSYQVARIDLLRVTGELDPQAAWGIAE